MDVPHVLAAPCVLSLQSPFLYNSYVVYVQIKLTVVVMHSATESVHTYIGNIYDFVF